METRRVVAHLSDDLDGFDSARAPTDPVTRAIPVIDRGFAAFYRAERGGLVAVVASLTGDRAAAEDIVQEAFATALRRWHTVGGYDRPADWVKRVALNRSISRFRRGRIEQTALRRVAGEREIFTGAHEEHELLWSAVRRLPRRQAQVIALMFIEDLTIEGAATVLGLSAGTVKSHLHRAKKALAAELRARTR